jgi:hypothetical protein
MGGIDGAVADGGGVIEQLKFYSTTDTSTIVCWPWFCRDLTGCPRIERPTLVQRVSGSLGTLGELPGIPVFVLETERVSSEQAFRRQVLTGLQVVMLGEYTTICTTTLSGLWGMGWDLKGRRSGSVLPRLLIAWQG